MTVKYWLNPLSMRSALRLREFEPQGWTDWALIPWWVVRYLFAWCWAELWRLCLIVKHWDKRRDKFFRGLTTPGSGRHTDPRPVMCPRCLWAGPARWLIHDYNFIWPDDVEPVDLCPRCQEEL